MSDPFFTPNKAHPSTWEAETKALRARVAELDQTVDGIWRYAVDTTVSDHHFRGWAEVEARAALEGKT
jgi:hypothetical protein